VVVRKVAKTACTHFLSGQCKPSWLLGAYGVGIPTIKNHKGTLRRQLADLNNSYGDRLDLMGFGIPLDWTAAVSAASAAWRL